MNLPNFSFENKIWELGKLPAGVDEAGRGPLAGPVIAAAVILPYNCSIEGINDSKKLSTNRRELLYNRIKEESISTSIGIAGPEEIDTINILKASLLAMERAVINLDTKPYLLFIDGIFPTSLKIPQKTIPKGDTKCCSIAAASIIAKVTRDKIMDYYHKLYPEYNFTKHKGYPTKEHLEAISKHGCCPIHRKSFKGVL